MCYKESQLDIAQFLSIPSISFCSMLKQSKVKLKLISDINLFLIIEKNLRGGYCGTHKRLCVSNHSKIPYADPLAPTSIIMSQDFSALYGSCMRKYLPTSARWGTIQEFVYVKQLFENDGYLSLTGEESLGFLILCDLIYPEEIKKLLSK